MSASPRRLLYSLGARLRNPSLARNLAFLARSQSWSRDELRDHQVSRCRDLLKFAGKHSPYYSRLFAGHGFRPDQFEDLEQLGQLPITEKSALVEHADEIHTVGHEFKRTFLAETSGSSGQVLKFHKNEEWDSWNRATAMRGLSWYGVHPADRNAYFWGYNIDPKKAWRTRVLDALQNRFRVFSYDRSELRTFIERLGTADYLHGYSSMIYEVAKIVNEESIDVSRVRLKLVKGTSEKILDHYHDEVQMAFGQSIVSEYGASESGIIAFECTAGSMHIQSEGVIVEDDGGEIVVTNLNSLSFPIIRYRLGDYVEYADSDYYCPCGMQHPVIQSVVGRIGKRIMGHNNTYPSLTLYYVFKNVALDHGINLSYQCVQNAPGKLSIRIEQPVSQTEIGMIDHEMAKYFGDDLDYEIAGDQTLHTMDGKIRDFISTVS